MRDFKGEKNPFFGRRHTEETRRKMSEAAKHRETRRVRGGVAAGGYRLLMAAVVKQAVKDKAISFLESEAGRSYCDAVGVNPDTFRGARL